MRRRFNKVLIANRGEIAVRLIRACHELGMLAVAVYSDVDRRALHVLSADEAYRIGPAPAAESYLNIERILAVAERSAADAIHPGYGFLAENAEFAAAAEARSIKFIGPPAAAIEIMGSKTRARREMERAGVPLVPGTSAAVETDSQARAIASQLGYPVMLKAAAGGGGKGMRWVETPDELGRALEAARSEAKRSFGDDEVYLEKAIPDPRHIEMQVLADEHGHCVYLGERECSIQRRHQKVLEESPSPIATRALRERMGEAAVRAAEAAGYTNAGTVEFLVDASGNFYFLEMNTRLQVEHPVTELVTGLDLVHWQIRIAAGEPLPFRETGPPVRGHAIECRVYAEDPENHFFPSPGTITSLEEPSGPGIRVDGGIYPGWRVPIEYDPLLAKLIAYGESREQAIARLRRALDEYVIGGVRTNLALFRQMVADPDFLAGKTDTGYLARLLAPRARPQDRNHQEVAAIAAAVFSVLNRTNGNAESPPQTGQSLWKKAAREQLLRER